MRCWGGSGKVAHQKRRSLQYRNLALAVCSVLAVVGETARADLLWYELERGSQLDLMDRGATPLRGELALLGCGDAQAEKNPKRDRFLIDELRLDETQEALESQMKNQIGFPLFGGPGISTSGRYANMHVRPDGVVSDFQWILRFALDWESASEAALLRRDLVHDKNQPSTLRFANPEDACPESMELHLVLEDLITIYVPEEREGLPGEWFTAPKFLERSREPVGQVTLFARAIPGSGEAVREPARARTVPFRESPPSRIKVLERKLPPERRLAPSESVPSRR